MSLHFIGQRFRVSRGGCWQCGSDCSSQLAEVLTFSSVAYNGQVYGQWLCMATSTLFLAGVLCIQAFKQTALGGLVKPATDEVQKEASGNRGG